MVSLTVDPPELLRRLLPTADFKLVAANLEELKGAVQRVANAARVEYKDMIDESNDVYVEDDPKTNSIVAYVPPHFGSDDSVNSAISSAAFPVSVSVVRTAVTPMVDDECRDPIDCGPNIRGGMKLTQSESCTSGFNFRIGNTPYASTAGHCDASGSYTHTSTDEGSLTLGPTFVTSVASDGIDAKLISVSDRDRWFPRGTVLRAHDNDAPVLGKVAWSASTINDYICKGGWKTFDNTGAVETCGQIRHWNTSWAGNVGTIGAMDGCVSVGGDSGAAVFSLAASTLAYGILKGHGTHPTGPFYCYFSWTSVVETVFGASVIVQDYSRRGDQQLLLTPIRTVDTRSGSPLAPGVPVSVAAQSWPGIPAQAQAAIVNLTVVTRSASGFLKAWAQGSSEPLTSVANFSAGENKASTMILPLGISIFGSNLGITLESSVTTDLLIDVVGWIVTPTAGASFQTVAPQRALDFVCNAGNTCTRSLAGANGIPTNATGVAINVTVTQATQSGWVSVGGSVSGTSTSTVNFTPGDPIANLTFQRLNSSGDLQFYAHRTVRILVDVLGYSTAASLTPGLTYNSVAPRRQYDQSTVPAGSITVAVSQQPLPVVPGGPPVLHPSIDAVMTSLAISQPTQNTWVTVWRYGTAVPSGTSSLNILAFSPAVSNHAVVRAEYDQGDAKIRHRSEAGTARRIVDAEGYFD